MRSASWSGSNPTVMLDAPAYFRVNLPSPHPTSKTRLFVNSAYLWRIFRSNPSGSFCKGIFSSRSGLQPDISRKCRLWQVTNLPYEIIIYFDSFFIVFADSVISSFKTFLSTSSSFLIYKHPTLVLYLPSFFNRSLCESKPPIR